MLPITLNHMTAAQADYAEFLSIAHDTGCASVELRNDLSQQLFGGLSPKDAATLADSHGLVIESIAEVKEFNAWSDTTANAARALARVAVEASAKAINLIPRNDGLGLGNGERQANLRLALRELKPILEEFGILGLVEPLGFEQCALRRKSEVVDAIEAVGGENCIKLVHDTFHHHLAGEEKIFPEHTAIVHISGVTDVNLAVHEMKDQHRVLVDSQDRLGNVTQIFTLKEAGYNGPISFEAFAPEVHSHKNLRDELSRSIEFVRTELTAMAA